MSDPKSSESQNTDIQTNIDEELQARLNAVIAQASDRDEAFGQFSQQISSTNERIARIEDAIQRIAAGSQAPQRPKAESNLSALLKPASAPDSSAPLDIAGLVRSAVQEAIEPIAAREKQRAQMEQLLRQQEASFGKAVQILPGLKNEASREAQVFDRIINSRKDLAGLPDAPMLVATMVQGLLAGEKREQQQQAVVKQQLTNPSPRSASVPTGTPRTPSDMEEVKEIHSALLEKGREQGLSNTNELAQLIRSQLTLQLKQED